jgi:outer membrane protein TolC
MRRVELRRQKWQIRRRELEVIASKNRLLPQLDGVARYRWRGLGDDLFPLDGPPAPPNEQFNGAYSNLTSGNFQEWQLGFELNVPIGFRHAHAAARNAELLLARERSILQDQQREVVHEAADAIAEMDRAYAVLQSNYNRVVASRDQLSAFEAKESSGETIALDLLLDAQRRVADTAAEYAHNRARYAVATKNVHYVKGTLLDHDGVQLAEGPWPADAHERASEIETLRFWPRSLNSASSLAPVVSRGEYPQSVEPMYVEEVPPSMPLPLDQPLEFDVPPVAPLDARD